MPVRSAGSADLSAAQDDIYKSMALLEDEDENSGIHAGLPLQVVAGTSSARASLLQYGVHLPEVRQ